MVLKEPCMSLILTILPVYLIKNRSNGLEKKFQDPLLWPCDSRIEQKMAVICRGLT